MGCQYCGHDLEFVKVKDAGWNEVNGQMLIIEEWDCLECDCVYDIVATGKVSKVEVRD